MKLSGAGEVTGHAHVQAAALVATDAERLRAMTRAAVRCAASRLDDVRELVVPRVKLERPHDALMTREALRAVVARTARRVLLHRFLAVIFREARAMRVAEAGVLRDQCPVREFGLDQAAELREVTVRTAALLRA